MCLPYQKTEVGDPFPTSETEVEPKDLKEDSTVALSVTETETVCEIPP